MAVGCIRHDYGYRSGNLFYSNKSDKEVKALTERMKLCFITSDTFKSYISPVAFEPNTDFRDAKNWGFHGFHLFLRTLIGSFGLTT